MRIVIDMDIGTLAVQDGDAMSTHNLFSKEAFERIARLWVQVGWVRKYSYGFSWFGRPIIQLPEDMIRIQEAIFQVKPDVIVETGVAHGGSLIYYASLCELMGRGRVIGIDIEVRPHNREAIETHPMFKRITMLEGSSVASEIVAQVKGLIRPGETVMLILDSNHSRAHVAAELEAYADLVTPGSYILSQDGVMQLVAGMPRAKPEWSTDNPITALKEFLSIHPEFEPSIPTRLFDETDDTPDCTHHPVGWLRRK